MAASEIPDEYADGLCRVYLIEDDVALLAELVDTLSEHGLRVFPFGSAEEFMDAGVLDDAPAVIVSDMVLPGSSGIRLLEAIRDANIETPMVYISGYSEPSQIIDGMKLGAVDFLWKPFKTEALLKAVLKSLALDAERLQVNHSVSNLDMDWQSLTEREQDVCRLMLRGFGNKEIAEQLEIKSDTANKHRMKVLKKLNVDSRAALMARLKDFEPIQR